VLACSEGLQGDICYIVIVPQYSDEGVVQFEVGRYLVFEKSQMTPARKANAEGPQRSSSNDDFTHMTSGVWVKWLGEYGGNGDVLMR
jgi:hypothetical protein